MYSGFKVSVLILRSHDYAALMPKGTNCIHRTVCLYSLTYFSHVTLTPGFYFASPIYAELFINLSHVRIKHEHVWNIELWFMLQLRAMALCVMQQAAGKIRSRLDRSNWWSRLFSFPNWVKIKRIYLLLAIEWRRKCIYVCANKRKYFSGI